MLVRIRAWSTPFCNSGVSPISEEPLAPRPFKGHRGNGVQKVAARLPSPPLKRDPSESSGVFRIYPRKMSLTDRYRERHRNTLFVRPFSALRFSARCWIYDSQNEGASWPAPTLSRQQAFDFHRLRRLQALYSASLTGLGHIGQISAAHRSSHALGLLPRSDYEIVELMLQRFGCGIYEALRATMLGQNFNKDSYER